MDIGDKPRVGNAAIQGCGLDPTVIEMEETAQTTRGGCVNDCW